MSLTNEQEDQVIRAVIDPGDDCAHNFAPLFNIIEDFMAFAFDAGCGHTASPADVVPCPDNPYRNASGNEVGHA